MSEKYYDLKRDVDHVQAGDVMWDAKTNLHVPVPELLAEYEALRKESK